MGVFDDLIPQAAPTPATPGGAPGAPPTTAASMVGGGLVAGPTGRSMATPAGQALAAGAMAANPDFDGTTFARRQKTANAFAAGPEAQGLTSLSTAIGHLRNMAKSFDALNNTSFPAWNAVANFGINQMGDPRVKAFGTDQQAVGDELEKTFTGGKGGTESGRKGWQSKFSENGSPDQGHGTIAEAARLLGSRVQALVQQYQSGMNTKALPPTLDPDHYAALKTLQNLDGKGGASAGARTAQAMPSSVLSIRRVK